MVSLAYASLVDVAVQQWGLFSTRQALASGLTEQQLRWSSRPGGPFERMRRAVYRLRDFPRPPHQELGAALLARGGDAVACGLSAGSAHGFDGVGPGHIEMIINSKGSNARGGVRRRLLDAAQIVALGPFRMTDALTTLLDMAASLDDVRWEWALEYGIRKGLFTLTEVQGGVAGRSQLHRPGVARARRVLALRPPNARPTGSRLETEFVQLIRPVREIPEPERQYPVVRSSRIVACLDFAYTEVQAYTEVHGGQHRESLQYDTFRETTVAATLGWLESEVTARDIRDTPRPTVRRLIEFIATAARRLTPAHTAAGVG